MNLITVASAKWIMALPIIVNRGGSGLPPTSKMELFMTILYGWKPPTTVASSSILDDSRRPDLGIVYVILQLPYRSVSIRNSFWIELDGFFCQTKINFAKVGPLPTSKMDLFVAIVDSWKLLTFIASSLNPHLLNCNF